MSIGIEIQFDSWSRRLIDGRLESVVMTTLEVFVRRAVAKAQAIHQSKHMHEYQGSGSRSPSDSLAVRTGKLKKSYRILMSRNNSAFTVTGEYGSRSRVAAIQESGGVIRSKGKMLTIPLRDGLPSAKVLLNRKNHFIKKAKTGNIFVWKQDEDGSITPLYLLRDQVRIPARRTLWHTNQELRRRPIREIQDNVAKATT